MLPAQLARRLARELHLRGGEWRGEEWFAQTGCVDSRRRGAVHGGDQLGNLGGLVQVFSVGDWCCSGNTEAGEILRELFVGRRVLFDVDLLAMASLREYAVRLESG